MNGHVRQRKGKDGKPTSWAFVIELPRSPQGKRVQRWQSGFLTKRAAERGLREALTAREQGTYREPCALTVDAFFEQWLAYKLQTQAPNTYRTYASVTRKHLIPAFAGVKLTNLRAREIDVWMAEAQTRLGPGAVAMCWKLLKLSLQQAVRWEYIARNPCDFAAPPARRVMEGETQRALSTEERALVVARLEGWLRMAAIVAIGTGLRRGEICGLLWRDIDWEAEVLHVRHQALLVPKELRSATDPRIILAPTKSEASVAPVRIGGALLEALAEHRQAQLRERILWGSEYTDLGLVFPLEGGALRDPQTLTTAWRKAAAELGLPVRFHDLRHDHATVLIEGGATMSAVSKRLRHSSPTVTSRVYAHVTERMSERTADLANDVLAQALKGGSECRVAE